MNTSIQSGNIMLNVKNMALSVLSTTLISFLFSVTMSGNANAKIFKKHKKKGEEYVLQCRGGGRMFARIPLSGNIEIYKLKRARFSASRRAPGKGECAWLDRPMRPTEAKMLYKTHKATFTHFDIGSNFTHIAWKSTPIMQVLRAIQQGKLFYVHVRNENGWLVIKRVGV